MNEVRICFIMKKKKLFLGRSTSVGRRGSGRDRQSGGIGPTGLVRIRVEQLFKFRFGRQTSNSRRENINA